MKTTFKILFTLLVMFSSLILVSCKDDDDDNSTPSIVGAWAADPFQFEENNPLLVAPHVWYKKDGSLIVVDVFTDPKDKEKVNYEYSDAGKWSVSGESITQTTNYQWDDPNEFDTDVARFSINGSVMTVTFEDVEGINTIQLKRIKEEKMQEVYNAAKDYYHKLNPNK